MSPVGENLFVALTAGLADFRAQVEGEPGRKIRALGASEGTIPDLVRHVLTAVADALAWLAGALGEVVNVLRVADALRALLEVATDLVGGLASLSFGDLPEKFGIDPAPFRAVEDAVDSVHSAMEVGERAMGLIPTPEDLAGVRSELKLLLGKRADPALTDSGALGALLTAVEKRPSSTPAPRLALNA